MCSVREYVEQGEKWRDNSSNKDYAKELRPSYKSSKSLIHRI